MNISCPEAGEVGVTAVFFTVCAYATTQAKTRTNISKHTMPFDVISISLFPRAHPGAGRTVGGCPAQQRAGCAVRVPVIVQPKGHGNSRKNLASVAGSANSG